MKLSRLVKVELAIVAAAAIAALAGFVWYKLAPREVPPGQPPLVTLRSGELPTFLETFNAGEGEVRLLTLLSPT